jgi:NCS1 family nucleobase:cation symporter-1
VLIADYFVIRHTHLNQSGLYQKDGPYWYTVGFNPRALIALVVGIGLCVPGFLAEVGKFALESDAKANAAITRIPDFWGHLYSYAWFTSFGVAFVLYVVLTKVFARRRPSNE